MISKASLIFPLVWLLTGVKHIYPHLLYWPHQVRTCWWETVTEPDGPSWSFMFPAFSLLSFKSPNKGCPAYSWAVPLDFLPLYDPVQAFTGTWTGPPEAQSIGFLCPLAPSSCKVSFPLSVLVVSEANWGTMSFSDCLDPNKRSFLLLLNLPSQFSFPVFPKKQRPETSKF